jgi:hypothetical protein
MTHVISLVGECGRTCNDWHQFLGLMSDLPHLAFEITLTIIQDVLLYQAWKHWGKPRWIARQERRLALEHARLDAEHGVSHG